MLTARERFEGGNECVPERNAIRGRRNLALH